jgi:hypothetical protein
VEKGYCLNISSKIKGDKKEVASMSLGEYFEILKYFLVGTTFIVLVLIFLYMLYGKEEKTS